MSLQVRDFNLGAYAIPSDVEGGICLDIGANVGCFSQRYRDVFSTIHYFEPLPQCFEKCEERLGKFPHIKGHNVAVWSATGETVNLVNHSNNDSGSAGVDSPLLCDDWDRSDKLTSVTTSSLDDILTFLNLSSIDFCKLDCETSEYNILMKADLSKIKYIAVELHNQMGHDRWYELVHHLQETHTLIHGNIVHTPGANHTSTWKLR